MDLVVIVVDVMAVEVGLPQEEDILLDDPALAAVIVSVTGKIHDQFLVTVSAGLKVIHKKI